MFDKFSTTKNIPFSPIKKEKKNIYIYNQYIHLTKYPTINEIKTK